MDTSAFWTIIDAARADAGNDWEDMLAPLQQRLSALEKADLMLWQQIFYEYHHLSYKNKLWAAAYIINGGCSDDGFDYFRGWLIAQGKRVFMDALRDPDSLAGVDSCEGDVEYEDILSAAMEVYFRAYTGGAREYDAWSAELDAHPLPGAMAEEMKREIRYAEDIDKDWDDEDEDALAAWLPKLAEAFE